MKKKYQFKLWLLIFAVYQMLSLCGCSLDTYEVTRDLSQSAGQENLESAGENIDIGNIPEYSGNPSVVLNQNKPRFAENDLTTESFETYDELDALGRCQGAYANVGVDLMPTEKRGDISRIKPTGWQSVRYDFVEGKNLYNRCHLIGFQLTGENANNKNLITGTRYMNVQGMLPYENEVADYVKETQNHVLYRVTPIFDGDNLVADGVQMEAFSVEDNGEGIQFHVYVYNVQPGVEIDYATGESKAAETDATDSSVQEHYVLNTNTKKFHKPTCGSAIDMKEENKEEYTGSRELLIEQGYVPCGNCKP